MSVDTRWVGGWKNSTSSSSMVLDAALRGIHFASDRSALPLALVGCLAVAASCALTSFAYGQPDDAYITYAFARNVAEGHGFVWFEGGPRVFGSTTLTWTLILAAFSSLGLGIPTVSVLLSAASWGAACFLLYRLLWPLAGVRSLALFPLMALSIPVFGSSAGMESGVYTLLCLSCFVLYANGRLGASLLVGAILMLTRLDGALVPLMVCLHALSNGSGIWRVLRAGLPSLVVLASSFGALGAYFGNPLPLSFMAKAGFSEGVSGYFRPQFYLELLGGSGASPLLVLATVGGCWSLTRWRDPRLLSIFWVPLYTFMFFLSGMPAHGWYYAPGVLGIHGAFVLGTTLLLRGNGRGATPLAVGALVVSLAVLPFGTPTNPSGVKPSEALAEAVVADVEKRAVKEPDVVTFEVGYEGYLAGAKGGRVHDVLGLVSPDAYRAGGWRDPTYLLDKVDPEYVVITEDPEYAPTSPVLSRMGREYERILTVPGYSAPYGYTVFGKKVR